MCEYLVWWLQCVIFWIIYVPSHYIPSSFRGVHKTHYKTCHGLCQYSGITFYRFLHFFNSVHLLFIFVFWSRYLHRFAYTICHWCSCGENVRKLTETVLGLPSSLIDIVNSFAVSTLCSPCVRRSNLLYPWFAISSAAPEAVVVKQRLFTKP